MTQDQPGTVNPVDLATRLVNVLSTEQRESTYKEALIIGLIQECVASPLTERVSLFALADRFIDVYWQQLNVFPGVEYLLQVRQGVAQIPKDILDLKNLSVLPREWRPGRARTTARYLAIQRSIAQTIARMPATHLQNPGGVGGVKDFLFDSSWLRKKVTVRELDENGWSLALLPGVQDALVSTSSLLIPVVQLMWEQDLRRFNAVLASESVLNDFLFGDDRVALKPVSAVLAKGQAGRCFYCGRPLPQSVHVDHVVPWSRSGLNDLANLVAVDPACNIAKSDALPSLELVELAAARDYLRAIAEDLDWELDPYRVVSVARVLHKRAPLGTRVWGARGQWETKVSEPRHEVGLGS